MPLFHHLTVIRGGVAGPVNSDAILSTLALKQPLPLSSLMSMPLPLMPPPLMQLPGMPLPALPIRGKVDDDFVLAASKLFLMSLRGIEEEELADVFC